MLIAPAIPQIISRGATVPLEKDGPFTVQICTGPYPHRDVPPLRGQRARANLVASSEVRQYSLPGAILYKIDHTAKT
jgi:hypothetical protein